VTIAIQLVGGIPTPLKNMTSSVGMIVPNVWKIIKVMFQSPPTSPSSEKSDGKPFMKKWGFLPAVVLNSPRLGSGILSFPGIWIPNVPSRLTNLARLQDVTGLHLAKSVMGGQGDTPRTCG